MTELDERIIRERACQLWEQAGKPEGMDQHFWLKAERQLRDELVRHELKTPDNL
jgi:predicted DNA-binding transcriptional regulator YafY